MSKYGTQTNNVSVSFISQENQAPLLNHKFPILI